MFLWGFSIGADQSGSGASSANLSRCRPIHRQLAAYNNRSLTVLTHSSIIYLHLSSIDPHRLCKCLVIWLKWFNVNLNEENARQGSHQIGNIHVTFVATNQCLLTDHRETKAREVVAMPRRYIFDRKWISILCRSQPVEPLDPIAWMQMKLPSDLLLDLLHIRSTGVSLCRDYWLSLTDGDLGAINSCLPDDWSWPPAIVTFPGLRINQRFTFLSFLFFIFLFFFKRFLVLSLSLARRVFTLSIHHRAILYKENHK